VVKGTIRQSLHDERAALAKILIHLENFPPLLGTGKGNRKGASVTIKKPPFSKNVNWKAVKKGHFKFKDNFAPF
jgi:hypothetical protein